MFVLIIEYVFGLDITMTDGVTVYISQSL